MRNFNVQIGDHKMDLAVEGEGRGADTGPVVEATGAPAASLRVDGERYFIYHHTPADTLDRLRRGEAVSA